MDCIFCKIIKAELPAKKVYEDRRFLAILDINPINKGHVLVLPKEHYDNLTDTPVDVVKDLIAVIKNLCPAVVESSGGEGFNLILNNGRVAGQLIEHLHWHIIPRLKNDNLHPWPGKQYQEGEMDNYAKRIINTLKD